MQPITWPHQYHDQTFIHNVQNVKCVGLKHNNFCLDVLQTELSSRDRTSLNQFVLFCMDSGQTAFCYTEYNHFSIVKVADSVLKDIKLKHELE